MERIVQLLKDLEAIHSPSGYTDEVTVTSPSYARRTG